MPHPYPSSRHQPGDFREAVHLAWLVTSRGELTEPTSPTALTAKVMSGRKGRDIVQILYVLSPGLALAIVSIKNPVAMRS